MIAQMFILFATIGYGATAAVMGFYSALLIRRREIKDYEKLVAEQRNYIKTLEEAIALRDAAVAGISAPSVPKPGLPN